MIQRRESRETEHAEITETTRLPGNPSDRCAVALLHNSPIGLLHISSSLRCASDVHALCALYTSAPSVLNKATLRRGTMFAKAPG